MKSGLSCASTLDRGEGDLECCACGRARLGPATSSPADDPAREIGDGDHRELASEPCWDCSRRHDRRSESFERERREQSYPVDFCKCPQCHSVSIRGPGDDAAKSGSLRREEEGVLVESLDRQLGFIGPGMTRVNQQYEVLRKERLDVNLRIVDGEMDDHCIELAGE
jgi:hypothetical protein